MHMEYLVDLFIASGMTKTRTVNTTGTDSNVLTKYRQSSFPLNIWFTKYSFLPIYTIYINQYFMYFYSASNIDVFNN